MRAGPPVSSFLATMDDGISESVLYWDTVLEPQLYKPNRLWAQGRVMGESPGSHGILLGAPPGSARACNISQAYDEGTKGRFFAFGSLWKVGKQRWALTGWQRTARLASYKRFTRA